MRVLHLLKTSIGAAWALRQMKQLVNLGLEVHVALPSGGALIPAYKAVGIVVHYCNADFTVKKPWLWPEKFKKLRDLVANVCPDIIHSHFVGTTLTMRLALGKTHPIPRIFQVPGPLHLEHAFFRRAELVTAGPLDYWIGSCEWTCDRYRKSGISQDRLFLSYYGVDIDKIVGKEPGKLRRELRIDTDVKIVGMVAFMYAPKRYLGQRRGLKGHEDLIDAIAICLKTEPNIVCVFVGGAWNNGVDYENRVREYGKKQCGDRAIFLGTRNDVPELYSDIDVVVHPSHSENVGGAAESLLLAVPTIATNVGGFPDLIVNGETGWLVPARDPDQLAVAILKVLENPVHSHEMALRGQLLANKLFNVKETAYQLLKIYQTINARHKIQYP